MNDPLEQTLELGDFLVRHQVQAKDDLMPQGISLQQVHGDRIFIPSLPVPADAMVLAEGFDAVIWQYASPCALHIKTADCLPVVIADSGGRAYANVHAGWRGLAARIITKTIFQLNHLGISNENLQVYIGPAISQPHYEVGEELNFAFRDLLYAHDSFKPLAAKNKYLFDLKKTAVRELLELGIEEGRILISPACTFNDSRLPSYRRDRSTMRLLTSVWRRARIASS